jgi:uncharacterized protein YkwD
MKALITLVLLFAVCFSAGFAAFAAQTDPPRIRIDGEFINITGGQDPVIVNGRTLVPLRDVMEPLGFIVDWIPPTPTLEGMNPQFPHGRVELTRPEWQRADVRFSGVIDLSVGSEWLVYRPADTPIGAESIGIELDVRPQLVNSRTMVPVRAIAEMTGFVVTWVYDEFVVDIQTGRQSTPTPPPTQSAGLEAAIRDGLTFNEIRKQFPNVTIEEIQPLFEQEVIQLVNEIRREHGLNELILHDGVARSARSMAEAISQHGRHPDSAHICPITGLDWAAHTRQYAPDIRATENFARVTARPQGAINTWMASARGHRETIIRNPATYIGVGMALCTETNGAIWILRVGTADR